MIRRKLDYGSNELIYIDIYIYRCIIRWKYG